MPRRPPPSRPSARAPKRTSARAPARTGTLQTLGRRTLAGLRNLGIGLAMASAVSYLPASVTARWSAHAQRGVTITHDIRVLLGDVGIDAMNAAGGVLPDLRGVRLPIPAAAPLPATVSAEKRESWPEPFTPPTELPQAAQLPHAASSFSAAKRLLYERVYTDHRITFYCGCGYDPQKQTALESCGLGFMAANKRAQRVEAEHIFPAAQFGQSLACWRAPATFPQCLKTGGGQLSGRACCEKVDPTFATAHNDLQNLVPAVGAINGKRSDFNWGMVSGGERFGDCAIRIDASTRRVEPPSVVRGDVARTMLYMRDTYGFRLSRQDEQLYAAWNNADPPDTWEIDRNHRISQIQGRGNRYVEEYKRL